MPSWWPDRERCTEELPLLQNPLRLLSTTARVPKMCGSNVSGLSGLNSMTSWGISCIDSEVTRSALLTCVFIPWCQCCACHSLPGSRHLALLNPTLCDNASSNSPRPHSTLCVGTCCTNFAARNRLSQCPRADSLPCGLCNNIISCLSSGSFPTLWWNTTIVHEWRSP